MGDLQEQLQALINQYGFKAVLDAWNKLPDVENLWLQWLRETSTVANAIHEKALEEWGRFHS